VNLEEHGLPPPRGAERPFLYAVGGSPPGDDGRAWSDSDRRKLRSELSAAGLDPSSDVRFSYSASSPSASRALLEDVAASGAERVLALGGEATAALWPDAEPRARGAWFSLRGSAVPLPLPDGRRIPAVVAWSSPRAPAGVDDDMAARVWAGDVALAAKGELSVPERVKPSISALSTEAEVRAFFPRLVEEKTVAFDFETTGLYPYPRAGISPSLYSVAFAFDGGDCAAIPLGRAHWPPALRRAILSAVGKWISELAPEQTRIAHNLKFDLAWGLRKAAALHSPDARAVGRYEDTMLLAYLLNELPGTVGLKTVAWARLGASAWSIDSKRVQDLPLASVLRYNALDAFYTLRLWRPLRKDVEAQGLIPLYERLMVPASMRFMRMEMRGLDVDVELLDDFQRDYTARLDELRRAAAEAAGDSNFDVGSPRSVLAYLHRTGRVVKKKTVGGAPSTDAETLRGIQAETGDEVCGRVLEYRAIEKLNSTYIVGIRRDLFDDGRLHGNFRITGTVTGRTSSHGPNLQNFPKRNAEGVKVRAMIRAPEGHKVVAFDYGQIEARLFAVISGDERYISDLEEGYDIHREKAIDLFHRALGWSVEDAVKKRSAVKNQLVFPAFYGAGRAKVSKLLGVEQDLAQEAIDSIFNRYPRLRRWQRETVEFEKRNGYVESLFGRRRRSPMSYNQLLNHPSQSTASDMTLSSLASLGRKFRAAFMIHDDLTFFLPESNLEESIREIIRAMLVVPWYHMAESPRLRAWVPMEVECAVGDNWCDLEEVCKMDSLELGITSLAESAAEGGRLVREYEAYEETDV